MSLQNVQAEFAEIIHGNEESTGTVLPAENSVIYRQNAQAALKSTLCNAYPLIHKLLGDDFFHVAAREYIQQYPSRSSNLHDYGEYFSRFLAHYPPVKNLVYLVEVAEFEWLCHTLYFAADHSGFDFRRLQLISVDQYVNLRFSLHPASKVVKFHFPLLDIIDLCKHDPEIHVNINAGGINLLIIRRDLELKLVPLSDEDYVFLEAIQNGEVLSEGLSRALNESAEFNLEAKLSAWIQDKTIVDFENQG